MHTITQTNLGVAGCPQFTYKGIKFDLVNDINKYCIAGTIRLSEPRHYTWREIIDWIDNHEQTYQGTASTISITQSGNKIDVLNPKPEMFFIQDIAHALSLMCRYNGHTPVFYSVAEHSVLCVNQITNPVNKLAMLLHDASEAFIGDIIRPLKHLLPAYEEIEHNMMFAISEKFNFQYPFNDEIREVDDLLLKYELEHFMYKSEDHSHLFNNLSPEQAKKLFLQTYLGLTQ